LRWRGRLDLAIHALCEKKKPTGWLKRVLQVAAYQLIVQDQAPAPAVVSETVDLVRNEEGAAPAAFTNAILRKLAEQGKSWRTAACPRGVSAEEQAAWASLPSWIWKRLVKQQGIEAAERYAIAMLDRPQVWLREQGSEPRLLGPDSARVTEVEGFGDGKFFVQDLASQRLVREFGQAAGKPGRVLDLCAAPGGKSFGLEWDGWQVFAADPSEPRMELMRENVKRLRSRVQLLKQEEITKHAPYDLVWVDAPCTGTGVLRRHPEIRWNKTEKDLASLVTLQGELLASAAKLVAPGGFLAYTVCSVLAEEGPNQRGYFLKTHAEFSEAQALAIAPEREPPCDGFYGSLLQRHR
jgi:16S rRNA (cytosine967-C5)-methyltransferase